LGKVDVHGICIKRDASAGFDLFFRRHEGSYIPERVKLVSSAFFVAHVALPPFKKSILCNKLLYHEQSGVSIGVAKIFRSLREIGIYRRVYLLKVLAQAFFKRLGGAAALGGRHPQMAKFLLTSKAPRKG
jgi:hypothetical protein